MNDGRRLLGLICLLSLFLSLLLLVLARSQVAAWYWELPPYTHDFGERRVEMVEMRDGTRLATHIYTPAGNGAWPTILVRSPYNAFGTFELLCQLFIRYGYGCVHQDVRGRLDSEGEWIPLIHERADGLDTLAWLADQPWQNGNLALFGPSYLGAVQWSLADALPPAVKTIVPTMFGTDIYHMAYENGIFRPEIMTAWVAVMPDREMHYFNGGAYQEALTHRPPIEIDERFFGRKLAWFRDIMASQGPNDDFWQRPEIESLRSMPQRTEVPVLMFAAWYDYSIESQLEMFAELKSRERSKLVVGPWSHVHRDFGDLELPNDLELGAQWAIVLDWLAHHLRGEPLAQKRGVVETYVLEEGRWQSRSSWPPASEPLRLHLGALQRATGCSGGVLSEQRPRAAARVSYRYDPADPVPSTGGGGLLAFAMPGLSGIEPGSIEQPDRCERQDVLTFLGPILKEPLYLAGALQVRLTVSSDAPDTAFAVKVVRIDADGTALNLREGITSLAYRNGSGMRLTYQPHSAVDVTIRLRPIEWRLPPGSRLRLDVTSSSFPAYHTHPNLAGPWARQTEIQTATQTLYIGPGAQAYLEIPVVTGESQGGADRDGPL